MSALEILALPPKSTRRSRLARLSSSRTAGAVISSNLHTAPPPRFDDYRISARLWVRGRRCSVCEELGGRGGGRTRTRRDSAAPGTAGRSLEQQTSVVR